MQAAPCINPPLTLQQFRLSSAGSQRYKWNPEITFEYFVPLSLPLFLSLSLSWWWARKRKNHEIELGLSHPLPPLNFHNKMFYSKMSLGNTAEKWSHGLIVLYIQDDWLLLFFFLIMFSNFNLGLTFWDRRWTQVEASWDIFQLQGITQRMALFCWCIFSELLQWIVSPDLLLSSGLFFLHVIVRSIPMTSYSGCSFPLHLVWLWCINTMEGDFLCT